MKTHSIELQRIQGLRHDHHGLLHAKVQATVATRSGDDDGSSTLSLSVDNARVLFQLLKTQFAEIDGPRTRSQR